MRKKSLFIGSAAVGAATIVGTLALSVSSPASALASGTVPTTKLAQTPSVVTKIHPPKFGPFGRSVYTETVVPKTGGGYKTIEMVKGPLTAVSSTSISVKGLDTGKAMTANVTSSTKFKNITEATLVADLKAKTAVTVRVVESGGNALVVMVPPALGTRPTPPSGGLLGHGPISPPSSSSSPTA